jgi:hypothetical protein
MIANSEQCLSFVNSQLQAVEKSGFHINDNSRRRAVTFSRQAGCGAVLVAEKLAQHLKEKEGGDGAAWTVFDRNLIDQVLKDHDLPVRLARFLPEDKVSKVEDIISDVFGVHPPVQTMIFQTTETMLRLATLGHVILIGRAGNMITAKLPHVFHVRLVAPLEQRVAHAHKFYNMTESEALRFCQNEDRARERYVRRYFNADINDPTLYHMTLNTGLVGYDEAARLIGEAMQDLDPVLT